MPAQTPQQLATATACWRCLEAAPWVAIYLASQWAGVANPQTVATNSAPFQGFTGSEATAAMAYALAVIAGGSTDPATLSAQSACISCLDGELGAVNNYLLAALAGASIDPQTLVTAATAFQSVPAAQALVYLFTLKSGLTLSQITNGIACFECAGVNLDRVITMLLNDIAGGVIPVPPGENIIQLEDGSDLLLEDGTNILMEA